MSERRVAVRVSGHVQGVFYRAAVAEQARRLSLSGWVANAPAGHVEAEFQGETAAIEELLAFCARGPSGADVDDVEVVDIDAVRAEAGFAVR